MNKHLLAAYRYTTNNWALIQGSKLCGCCNCVEIFPADEIVGWTGLDLVTVHNTRRVRAAQIAPWRQRCTSPSRSASPY